MQNLPSLHLKNIFFKGSALKWARTLGVLLRGSLLWVYSIWPKFYLLIAFETNYKENAHFQKHREQLLNLFLKSTDHTSTSMCSTHASWDHSDNYTSLSWQLHVETVTAFLQHHLH